MTHDELLVKDKFTDLIMRAKERAEKLGTESDGTGAEYGLIPYQSIFTMEFWERLG